MHPVMTRLHQDHARLARLLDLFEGVMDRFHDGAEPDYELLCEMLEYMVSYLDIVHHPTEDLVFQRVLDKGFERRDVFDVLMRQHTLLGPLSNQFRESLDGILHEEVILREDVETQGRQLIGALRDHMRHEDDEAFPIAIANLSAEDWDAVEAAAPSMQDPLFATPDPSRYRALYQQLSEQSRD